jgi:hypothetical protein
MPTPTNHSKRCGPHWRRVTRWCPRCGAGADWIPKPSPAKPQAPRDTPDRSGESAEQALEAMQ